MAVHRKLTLGRGGQVARVHPEGLIAEIRRNAHYPTADWRAVLTEEPLDPQDISTRLRAALDEAEAFVVRMPTDKMGLLFLQDGKVVQPAPRPLGGVRDPCRASARPLVHQPPTSPPPCSSITNTHQAFHNVSSCAFCPMCKNQEFRRGFLPL